MELEQLQKEKRKKKKKTYHCSLEGKSSQDLPSWFCLQYHGGTNFGRTTSTFETTHYYDEAPLDEYGWIICSSFSVTDQGKK